MHTKVQTGVKKPTVGKTGSLYSVRCLLFESKRIARSKSGSVQSLNLNYDENISFRTQGSPDSRRNPGTIPYIIPGVAEIK